MSLRTQRSILVPTWEFDDEATIIDSIGEQTGFPVENIQDPQPRAEWRTQAQGVPQAWFVADYGSAAIRPMDTFVVGFANIEKGSALTLRWGNTNGIWHTEEEDLPLWTLDGGDTEPSHEPPYWYTGGGRGPIAVTRLSAPMTSSFRFLRVELAPNISGTSAVRWGRFTPALAVELDAVHGSEIPIPVGTPARLKARWDLEMPILQYELLAALLRQSGSEPRTIDSWGFDRYPLDGSRAVYAIGDYAASEPWLRHLSAVYGSIASCPPPRRDGALYKTSLSAEEL